MLKNISDKLEAFASTSFLHFMVFVWGLMFVLFLLPAYLVGCFSS